MGCCCSDNNTPNPTYKQLSLHESEKILHNHFIHCIVCKNLITTSKENITGCGKCHHVLGHLSCVNQFETCPRCGK
jgi:hypothetical protein